MKRTLLPLVLLLVPALAFANPNPGIYNSTDIAGGPLLTGRASTWRSGVNSGLPHVLHAQSWSGTLGTQWDISCPTESVNFIKQDNRVGGVGDIVYTSDFTGGTFTFFPGGWPWGDGSGTLQNTHLITTVTYILIGGVSTPVGSRVNGTTSGTFHEGCYLTFAIANGMGMGETSSGPPNLTKPVDYPTFLDGTCGPASISQQFGSWGNITQITMGIECPVPAVPSTWGQIKTLYR